jgi:hypothetical protein
MYPKTLDHRGRSTLADLRPRGETSKVQTDMTFGLSTRNQRRLKITSRRWQRRGIFLLGGIGVGAAAVALAQLADLMQIVFAILLSKSRYIC